MILSKHLEGASLCKYRLSPPPRRLCFQCVRLLVCQQDYTKTAEWIFYKTWIKDGIVINTVYLCFCGSTEAIEKAHVHERAVPAWGGSDWSSFGALKLGYGFVISTLNTE